VKLQTPCGTAWGHDGGTPSHVSISLISPDGSRQMAMMVTRDANSWTPQIGVDFENAVLTAFCGEAPPPATARSLAGRLVTTLPSLQRLR